MKERPILFSAPMVRALLDGRKTQTRRVVKHAALDWLKPDMFTPEYVAREANRLCPYGAPGERLWVRETWFPDPPIDGWDGDVSWQDERRIDGVPAHYRKPEHCIFDASWDGPRLRWRPGIHMPRWASRLTLDVTKVRVERLQDISEADAKAEGAPCIDEASGREVLFPEATNVGSYRLGFRALWHSINGAESWGANPWVWVVGFKVVGQ